MGRTHSHEDRHNRRRRHHRRYRRHYVSLEQHCIFITITMYISPPQGDCHDQIEGSSLQNTQPAAEIGSLRYQRS